MNIRFQDIQGLLRTPEGRQRVWRGVSYVLWPVTAPVARWYRKTILRRTRIIAVVGSLGKTTTRKIVAVAMGETEGERRKGVNIVGRMFRIPLGKPYEVFEAGVERKGQMTRLARVLAPDITVVTVIASEHQRAFGNLEVTRHEKCEMVRALGQRGLAILNGDDPNVIWMAGETRAKVITYGLGESNDVRASDVLLEWPSGLSFVVHACGETRRFQTRFVGRQFIYSFLAAVAVATAEGMTLDEVSSRVEGLSPIDGRMQIKRLQNGAVLLCDYFKSNYESMHAALDTLADIPARRKIVVFGDVAEPPETQTVIYGNLGERIGRIADLAVFVGERSRYRTGALRAGMAKTAIVHAGRSAVAAVAALPQELGQGDVVLIKGRSEQRMDRIALALEGRQIGCLLEMCWLRDTRCRHCSLLERGWEGRKPVT